MAYVNVADWNPEQVAEWLKATGTKAILKCKLSSSAEDGAQHRPVSSFERMMTGYSKSLDNVVLQYIRLFVEKNVNGQQLLDLQPNDLEKIGVHKIGHQEIILQAVELLKNFYYDLDRENLQLLALRLSCLAHSLRSELQKNHINSSVVSTQVLADVAIVVSAVKPLVWWLDRSPFCDQSLYVDSKNEFLKLSLEMAMSGMRDRFVDKPIEYILESCSKLAKLADELIQNVDDSLLLQPASLDLATLKKRPGDHLDIYVVPSFHGILQVGELKCNSAAHQSGKIEAGDQIVQINYQTVVGWEVKEVMSLLFEESSTEVLMTLKKRPRHSKVFGQIYIKPYRLPCKKQMSYSTKWNEILSPSRSELLTVPPHFGTQFRLPSSKPVIVKETQETTRVSPPSPTLSSASSISSRSSESELMAGPSSPNSARLYLPKPRIPVQRRATITGASPVSKHAPLSLEQFWHELKLEREWRSNSDEKTGEKSNIEVQLKRSSPGVHYSLNWSVHLCELNDKPKTDMFTNGSGKPDREGSVDDGIVPLKQRIDSLNRSIEQTGLCAKKPKLLPKPLLLNKNFNVKPEIAPRSPSKLSDLACKADASPRRERGRLDKSYSTPSYDYSIDSKEPPTFNTKLLEEKVKSAPDNITSEVEVRSDFKTNLELKAPTKTKKMENAEHNEYLEIKADLVEFSNDGSKMADSEDRTTNECNTNTGLTKRDADDSQLRCDSSPFKRPFTSNHSTSKSIPPNKDEMSSFTFSGKETESSKSKEMASVYGNCTHNCYVSQSSAKGVAHSPPISVPATLPRHKMESKITIIPPEPPPRPIKESPIHLKTKNFAVIKPASKIIGHKSPKTARKKNCLLTKRRNISVKELGLCDHEGWLYHRSRKVSRGTPQWIKGWFIIKGTIFYGFNSREATHARLMISLPGFTVSPAEEVKSRSYSFKVYHTGTTFYFAAESEEDLAAWVESFSRVTISEEELSIVVSETDGEDDDDSQSMKKEKSGHEAHGSHVAAMKKFAGLLSLSTPESSKTGEKKFNSLKKSSSQKSTKDDHQLERSHVASLDRKYLKFLGGSTKQNFMPVPTAHFRSYRRVPPMEKPPHTNPDSLQSTDSKLESGNCATALPSASPTRPPDMADYRLASLAKCNATNQRTQETSPPGGYMTLESFMLSRQEEERRHQSQHPRAANVLRVPQCHAPPPPTPTANLSAVAAIGRENISPHRCSSHPVADLQYVATSSGGKNWTQCFSRNSKLTDNAKIADYRSKCLKKTTQYQPPPWEPPNFGSNEETRLQPAFEMTLDRNVPNDNNNGNKVKKCEDSGGSASRLKSLFGNTKTDASKPTLINSPRLRRVLFRDKKSQNHSSNQTECTSENVNYHGENVNLSQVPVTQLAEIRLPNAPDYPGLEYPPIFEPGTYSLSDVSTLLRNRRMRTVNCIDDTATVQNENDFSFSSTTDTHPGRRNDDVENGNQTPRAYESMRFNEDDFFNGNCTQRPS